MIDNKNAIPYATQIIGLLMAKDATMVLGNPYSRAMLISLAKDLAALVEEGHIRDELQYLADNLKILTGREQ